jgi:hypothetical protein
MSGSGNHRREYKTWHFTCVLTPTPEISGIFSWYAHESQHTDKTTGPIMEVRNWIEKLFLNAEQRDCITFIALRFSRTDVATCLSNATARSPLPDLHYEGYIQLNSAIALPSLHKWIPHWMWNPTGGRLSQCGEYNSVSRGGNQRATLRAPLGI